MTRQVTVTLVRHGETPMNAKRLIQGHTDTPLSEKGMEQAEVLGRYLTNERFTRVYASNLERAHHTARLIISHSQNPVEIITDKRLRERGFGEAEGKYVPDVHEEAKKNGVPFHKYTPAGGETFSDVQERVQSFFSDLCKIADDGTEESENILVVTHGGWIVGLMRYITSEKSFKVHNMDDDGSALKIPNNTGRTRFTIGPMIMGRQSQSRIIDFELVNDTVHVDL